MSPITMIALVLAACALYKYMTFYSNDNLAKHNENYRSVIERTAACEKECLQYVKMLPEGVFVPTDLGLSADQRDIDVAVDKLQELIGYIDERLEAGAPPWWRFRLSAALQIAHDISQWRHIQSDCRQVIFTLRTNRNARV